MSGFQCTARAEEILEFMKEMGYPVFHLSNIFRRDVQYAVRDYYRTAMKKDIGTRAADACSDKIIEELQQKGIFRKHSSNTWVLHSERYLLSPKTEAKKEETPA